MGKKDHQREKQRAVEAVLDLLRKQAPLSHKQEKFCNAACIERFLKAKGESVKKAGKQLRSCLTWRDAVGTEKLIADEFSAELAEGVAYVAGHDDEYRPVMVFRTKQDHQKFHSQKLLTRLLVFTLEVAIQTMPKNVEQFVLLFDASFFRSASAFLNLLLAILKIMADYYPGRLYKAFVIDPPSLFTYLWKGVRPFVELSSVTMTVSSMDFDDSFDFHGIEDFSRASSLRFHPSSVPATAKIGSCASSRFAFTVSHHFDSLKPWYLTLTDTSASKVGPTGNGNNPPPSTGPALISPLSARSFSFASPVARTAPRGGIELGDRLVRKNFIPSTPLPQKTYNPDAERVSHPRTPRPSFLHSPAAFFTRKETSLVSKAEKSREAFLPYLRFYRRPYDEMLYRSKMKPPLGGLISIVAPQIKHRHMSVSQRF